MDKLYDEERITDQLFVEKLHIAIKNEDFTYGFPNDYLIQVEIAAKYHLVAPYVTSSWQWPRYTGRSWFIPASFIIDFWAQDDLVEHLMDADDESQDEEHYEERARTMNPELQGQKESENGINRMTFDPRC